ncbi:6,7-dimethyl-8-ribityllumazine synthase [Candidatus Woesearchaeota archaeon]|nr:6,7-dimethyl-8-ribityllumazine synthase [Candidatus Woesearchaeota archaeon]
MNIAIIVSDYNGDITREMERAAVEHAKKQKIAVVKIAHVPGAFDIPFAASKIIREKNIDGVVTLGAVIQGGTSHDEAIAHATAKSLQELSMREGKPIGFGISGPRMTREQAIARIESTATHAVDAVVKLL